MPTYLHTTRYTHLKHVGIIVPDDLPEVVGYAAGRRISDALDQPFLRSTANDSIVYPKDAFAGVVELYDLFDGLESNGPAKSVNLKVHYENPADCFVIDTELGPAKIASIRFQGELFIKETAVPLKSIFEYHNVDTDIPISQTATYESQKIGDNHWALTLHKDEQSGETQVMMVVTEPPNAVDQ